MAYNYVNNTLDTQKIQFLSGSQSELNKYLLDSNDAKSGHAKEGAFYLTTDTRRLYLGRTIRVTENGQEVQKTIPVSINAGISSVATLQELESIQANPGEFYYVSGVNVLCINNGAGWVQINPDTNTNDDTSVTDVKILYSNTVSGTYIKASTYNSNSTYYTYDGSAFSAVAAIDMAANDLPLYYIKSSDSGTSIVYSLTINQQQVNRVTGTDITQITPVTTYFIVNSSSFLSAQETGIVRSTAASNQVTLSLDGGVADSSKTVVLKGNSGISLSTTENSNDVIISGQPYRLAKTVDSGVTNLKLNIGTSDNVDTIPITTGSNLGIDTTASGIKIDHVTPTASVTSYQLTPDLTIKPQKVYYSDTNGTVANVTSSGDLDNVYEQITYYGSNASGSAVKASLSQGSQVRIPKIAVDANGHISSITDIGVTIPSGITGISADNTGHLSLSSGNDIISSQNADLYYTIDIDGQTNTIYNKNSLGSFYSASYVDNLIADQLHSLNALVYRGTIGEQNNENLPTANVAVGDTYLVASGVSSVNNGASTIAVRPGDLLIANGNEFRVLTSAEKTNFDPDDKTKIYYTFDNGTNRYIKVNNPNANNVDYYYINTGIIQDTITWTRIEAGDIDTKYSFSFNNNGTIELHTQGSSDAGPSFQLVGGEKITVVGSASGDAATYTFNHDPSGLIAAGNNSVTQVNLGSDRTGETDAGWMDSTVTALSSNGYFYVPYMTIDKYGHIVSGKTRKYQLPQSVNDNYRLDNNSTANPTNASYSSTYGTSLYLWKNNSDENHVAFLTGDTQNTVNTPSGGLTITGSSSGISISHQSITQGNSTVNTAGAGVTVDSQTRKLTAITQITRDAYGHVLSVQNQEFTLPDYTHKLVGSAITTSNGVTSITNTLYQGENDAKGAITYQSSTLSLQSNYQANSTTTTYTIDLEWHDF